MSYKSITTDDLESLADLHDLDDVLAFLEEYDFIVLNSTVDHQFVSLSRRLNYLDVDQVEAEIKDAYNLYAEIDEDFDHVAEEKDSKGGSIFGGLGVTLIISLVIWLVKHQSNQMSIDRIEIPPHVMEKVKRELDSVLADSIHLKEMLDEKFPIPTDGSFDSERTTHWEVPFDLL